MVEELEANNNVGIVGAKCLDADGYIWHAEIGFTRSTRIPYYVYRGVNNDWAGVSMRREFKAVAASCMLVRRETFEQVRGFTEGLQGFEDVDLCLKVGGPGFTIVYCPHSVVIHEESGERKFQKNFEASKERFRETWGSKITEDEDAIYFESQCFLELKDPGNECSRYVHAFQDQVQMKAWKMMAAIQRQAPARDFDAVRHYFEPREWPRNLSILKWGAEICREGGWDQLASVFDEQVLALGRLFNGSGSQVDSRGNDHPSEIVFANSSK